MLGKDAICALQKRMQDALQLLGIAQQTYLIALAKAQPQLVAGQIRAIDDTKIALENKMRDEAKRALVPNAAISRTTNGALNSETLPWRYSWFFGSYTSQSCSTFTTAYHARVQIPSWLTSRVWDFCVRSASHGWTYSLRQWSVRPRNGEIFRAASEGDLPEIIRLLENGQGSLYDRDPEGVTLLHLAAYHRKYKAIVYLMDKGLSVHEPDADGSTALDYLAYPETVEPQNISVVLDVLGLLKSAGELTYVVDALFDPDATTRDYMILGRLLFCVSSLFELFLEEFRQVPPEIRYISTVWWNTDPKVLSDALKADGIDDPSLFRQQLSNRYESSLHDFVIRYFLNIPGRPNKVLIWQAEGTVFQDWRNFTRWFLRGIELEELSNVDEWQWIITPLFAGLQASPPFRRSSPRAIKKAKNRLQQLLLFWVEDVKAAGVDLKKYGRQEIRLLHGGSGWDFANWNDIGETVGRPRLASFRYGAEPEDWELVWEEVFVEDFVGEFFSFSELPPVMPGAWVD